MSEVVAALIIACSNLTSGYPGVATQEDWAKKKSQCIQRVSECAAKKTEDNFNGDLTRTIIILRECSKEVHL